MLKHGDTKELTVVVETPQNKLGSALLTVGSKWSGWWNETDSFGKKLRKWKIDYNNGFVGYWEDIYFDYEGKTIK